MAMVGAVAICVFLGVVSNVMAADANQPNAKTRQKKNKRS